jgi:hypothetical protein
MYKELFHLTYYFPVLEGDYEAQIASSALIALEKRSGARTGTF